MLTRTQLVTLFVCQGSSPRNPHTPSLQFQVARLDSGALLSFTGLSPSPLGAALVSGHRRGLDCQGSPAEPCPADGYTIASSRIGRQRVCAGDPIVTDTFVLIRTAGLALVSSNGNAHTHATHAHTHAHTYTHTRTRTRTHARLVIHKAAVKYQQPARNLRPFF